VTKKRVHFKRRQNEFIQSLCYIPEKNMYLGAGLDMLVHIYDRSLNYLTALRTGERVIRHIIYNSKLDEVIIAGSGGCKSWKISRQYTNGANIFNLTVLRNYTRNKNGKTHWVSHIEFDNDSQRLICIEDDAVICINCETGQLVNKLRNIHEAPLTGCVWYNRSQYFVTSCAGGLVKVWAVHHDSNLKFGKQDFALLHTFTGHTKAVTALQLHPLSGLAVSVSLDGTLRVLNLEALEEIYAIQIMQPLIAMKCVKMDEHSLCIGATLDGTIRVWSINNFLGFYGVCRAVCNTRVCVYDVEDSEKMISVVTAGEEIRVFDENGSLLSNLIPGKLDGERVDLTYSMSHGLLFILHLTRKDTKQKQKQKAMVISVFDARTTPSTFLSFFYDPAGITENDVSTTMALINLNPVDVEEHQAAKVLAQRKTTAKEVKFKSASATSSMLNSGPVKNLLDYGFREGEEGIKDETMVFGTKGGSIVFTRVGPRPKTMLTFKDAHEGALLKLCYCEANGRLVSFGHDIEGNTNMKVWTTPDMRLVFMIPLRKQPTAIEFSPTLPMCLLGYEDGQIQLIEIVGRQPKEIFNPSW
jgi:WD40 repeat protein